MTSAHSNTDQRDKSAQGGMLSFLKSDTTPVRVGYVLIFAVAALSVIRHAWPDANYYPVDFKYFWLAGSLWADGVSPYGPELQALGKELFPGERINPFFYPPNWRLITTIFAAMPPDISESIWAALSAIALAWAAWICASIATILYPNGLSRLRVFTLAFGVIGGGAHAVEVSIQIGQPAPFLLLALSALLYVALKPNTLVTVAALTVLLLKPQLGVPVALACMFIPSMRKGLAAAIVMTGLLALYGLGVTPFETFKAFMANIALYGSFPENAGIVTSGPVFFIALASSTEISAFIFLGITLAVIACVGALLSRDGHMLNEEIALRFIFFASALSLFLMPTHNFDFLVLTTVLVLMWDQKRWIAQLGVAGIFLTMRAMSLSLISGSVFFVNKTVNVTLFDTIGSFAILVAASALLYHASQRKVGEHIRRPSKLTGEWAHE